MNYFRHLTNDDFMSAHDSVEDHGFCKIDAAINESALAPLLNEARLNFGESQFSKSDSGLTYEAYLSDLGPLAESYLRSTQTTLLLTTIFGGTYRLVPEKSCFTYYFCGGHLNPHLDEIPGERAVSMLTYLIVESRKKSPRSPTLDIYSRGTPNPGKQRTRIRTSAASLVMGYGAEVWHGRKRLRTGEVIVMINGSYRLDSKK